MKPLPVKRHHRLRRDLDQELKTEIKHWRRTLAHDEQAMEIADDLQKLIDAGWTERREPLLSCIRFGAASCPPRFCN
jgi:hypothetical protein